MKLFKASLIIYGITFLFLFLFGFTYAFYILKTNNNSNRIVEIIFGIIIFMILGLLYGNMIHKKGIIVGIAVGTLHILVIFLIRWIVVKTISFNFFSNISYLLSTIIGSIIGTNFKKII